MRIASIIAGILMVLPVAAQEPFPVLTSTKGDVPPRKMLHTYLMNQAKAQFDLRRQAIANLKTPDDVAKRQQYLRSKFIEAIGGFPEKTPLKPQVTGKLTFDGYTIEKIIFESRPNHHVTANLYLPKGPGPFPAVLMPIGHSSSGKADGSQQRAAILLAKLGIASLPYDPIGQAERKQLLDVPNPMGTVSMTSEHTLVAVAGLSIGQSTASFRIWDGIRAIDYLCSRPDIDAKKIGCTGCSGGGTMTSYLMSLDDRILAAAPSCYITSLERLFATIGPQDGEQNIPGQVGFGMEHADYLLMRAPRPTLLLAASQDFFDIQGTWTTFREASLVYGLMGHSERVALAEFNHKHGYPKGQREAMARWMSRWLLGKDQVVVEEPCETLKEKDLWCTRSGQVLEDLKGKSVFQILSELEEPISKTRGPAKDLNAVVRKTVALPKAVPTAKMTEGKTFQRDGLAIVQRVFTTEADIAVPALDFVPAKQTGDSVLYVHGFGIANDAGPDGPIEKLVRSGHRVLAIDPRGIGETAPASQKAPSLFGVEWREAFLSLHLGRPLLGQKTFDVLAVQEWLKSQRRPARKIVGIGYAGPIALHAAFLGDIPEVALDGSLETWRDVVRTPIGLNHLSYVVPGALKEYDLPDLARGLKVSNQRPVDARGQPK